MAINPNYKMEILLDVRSRETRQWDTVARFEYGIHAMEAARAMSEADDRDWRVVDPRHGGDPLTIIYTRGAAI